MMKRVADVMSNRPFAVTRAARVSVAAKLMLEEDVGAVPVVDHGLVVGMVTDRDIVLRVVAEGRDPEATSVDEIASTAVHCAEPDESLDDAYEQMAFWRVRRLPVVVDDQLVGIVAQADLVHELKDKKAGQLVDEISQPGQPAYAESPTGTG